MRTQQRSISQETKQFNVILSDQLHPDDRSHLLSMMAQFPTGAAAKQVALSKGFSVEVLDNHGRVLVLKWKGIEVALLFQRAIGKVSITPVENAPSVVINSPEDAWTTFNLLRIRYDQELVGLRKRVIDAESRAFNYQALYERIASEADQKGLVVDDCSKVIEQLKEELQVYKEAEKKGRSLPDGRQLLIKVKYKTRRVYVKPEKPKRKAAVKPVKSKKASIMKKQAQAKPVVKKTVKKKGRK